MVLLRMCKSVEGDDGVEWQLPRRDHGRRAVETEAVFFHEKEPPLSCQLRVETLPAEQSSVSLSAGEEFLQFSPPPSFAVTTRSIPRIIRGEGTTGSLAL